MYIVRNTFIAKPGSAGKLAELFKSSLKEMGGKNPRILIDAVTNFNKIIFEHEVDDFAEFDKMFEEMKEMRKNPKPQQAMSGYTDMYYTGKREIFRILE